MQAVSGQRLKTRFTLFIYSDFSQQVRASHSITVYYIALQPIAADDAPITANRSRLHFIAADNSKLHLDCNPP
jgi:hypothetical protein